MLLLIFTCTRSLWKVNYFVLVLYAADQQNFTDFWRCDRLRSLITNFFKADDVRINEQIDKHEWHNSSNADDDDA